MVWTLHFPVYKRSQGQGASSMRALVPDTTRLPILIPKDHPRLVEAVYWHLQMKRGKTMRNHDLKEGCTSLSASNFVSASSLGHWIAPLESAQIKVAWMNAKTIRKKGRSTLGFGLQLTEPREKSASTLAPDAEASMRVSHSESIDLERACEISKPSSRAMAQVCSSRRRSSTEMNSPWSYCLHFQRRPPGTRSFSVPGTPSACPTR